MKRPLFCLSTIYWLVFALPLEAQIYKWVDEEGNVHFGDYPQDEQNSEQMNIDYTNTMEGGSDLADSAAKNRERVAEEREQSREQAAKQAAAYQDPCKNGLAEYRKFTQVHQDSRGVPFYVYRNKPDGSPMSQQEHNQMVEAMRVKLVKRGCM